LIANDRNSTAYFDYFRYRGGTASTSGTDSEFAAIVYVIDAIPEPTAEPRWCVRCRKRKQFGPLCGFCSAGISTIPARTNQQVKNWKRKRKIKKKGRA
jgi:hypothetical protein